MFEIFEFIGILQLKTALSFIFQKNIDSKEYEIFYISVPRFDKTRKTPFQL